VSGANGGLIGAVRSPTAPEPSIARLMFGVNSTATCHGVLARRNEAGLLKRKKSPLENVMTRFFS
jgi:hypothetical protein